LVEGEGAGRFADVTKGWFDALVIATSYIGPARRKVGKEQVDG
jgi:hypothetical protein